MSTLPHVAPSGTAGAVWNTLVGQRRSIEVLRAAQPVGA